MQLRSEKYPGTWFLFWKPSTMLFETVFNGTKFLERFAVMDAIKEVTEVTSAPGEIYVVKLLKGA